MKKELFEITNKVDVVSINTYYIFFTTQNYTLLTEKKNFGTNHGLNKLHK
jgi:hypothetical protein